MRDYYPPELSYMRFSDGTPRSPGHSICRVVGGDFKEIRCPHKVPYHVDYVKYLVVAVFCGDILRHVGPDEFMASFSSNMLLSDIFFGFEGLHLR